MGNKIAELANELFLDEEQIKKVVRKSNRVRGFNFMKYTRQYERGNMKRKQKKSIDDVVKTFIIFFIIYFAGMAYGHDIYVSVRNGIDSNPGSIYYPVKSIYKAVNISRHLRQHDGDTDAINIIIHEGTYRLNRPIALNKDDYGLNFQRYQSDVVTITGSINVKNFLSTECFQSCCCNKSIMVLDFAGSEIEFNEHFLGAGLFIDNVSMSISRYPDTGFLKIDEVLPGNSFLNETLAGRFIEPGAYIHGLFSQGEGYYKTTGIDELGIVSLENKVDTLFEDQFIIVNSMNETDTPREFYIDKENRRVYFIPVNEQFKKIELAANDYPLIKISNAHDISFNGIIFDKSQTGLAYVSGDGNRFENCRFSHCSGTAVELSGYGNEVINCQFQEIGGTAIEIINSGSAIKESGVEIRDNWIRNYGKFRYTSPSVSIENSYCIRFTHNEIEGGPVQLTNSKGCTFE